MYLKFLCTYSTYGSTNPRITQTLVCFWGTIFFSHSTGCDQDKLLTVHLSLEERIYGWFLPFLWQSCNSRQHVKKVYSFQIYFSPCGNVYVICNVLYSMCEYKHTSEDNVPNVEMVIQRTVSQKERQESCIALPNEKVLGTAVQLSAKQALDPY